MRNRFHKDASAVGPILALVVISAAALGQEQRPSPTRAAETEQEATAHPTLAIGSAAPDFFLPGVDGKRHRLSEYKDSPVLAIVFTCNHCPTAQLYEGRIKKLVDDYRPHGVGFVAIQPNAPAAASWRELNYTDVEDTLDGMIIRARYRHFNFPYLYDGDTQQIAEAYGAKATPHIFVFDKQRKLQYEGRIDDNQREPLMKTQDARNALDALLAGRPAPVPHTPAFGCTTKWKSQIEMKQREAKRLESDPVTLEMACTDELKKLRANPTGHVLMVNFWATWCGPCVEEFHDLEMTYRWYRSRNFEFVTVSANLPDEKPAVLKVLQEEHATTRNLQFASEDTYGLMAAFDSKWDASVPFTIVIAPDGKVIYREEGEVNVLALRRAILANLPDGGYIGNAAYWAQK